MTGTIRKEENPLETTPIGKLLLQFALPTVISLLVNSIYNMVAPIFIGWGVGALGNSAAYHSSGCGFNIDGDIFNAFAEFIRGNYQCNT